MLMSCFLEHVKNTVFTVWRESPSVRVRYPLSRLTSDLDTCGSVSMLPKDKGGVVDPSLKVCKSMHFSGRSAH